MRRVHRIFPSLTIADMAPVRKTSALNKLSALRGLVEALDPDSGDIIRLESAM
jgi:hypothetical protein